MRFYSHFTSAKNFSQFLVILIVGVIKNLAVYPNFQNQGYGKKIIDAICKKYLRKYKILELGTGDSPLTIPFYLKCGFKYAGRIEKFFIKNYEREIYECGVKLVDMIILQKNLAGEKICELQLGMSKD